MSSRKTDSRNRKPNNKRKKKDASSYLLAFLCILAAALLFIIIYLIFFKGSQSADSLKSSYETAELDGFTSDNNNVPTSEPAGPVQATAAPEEITVPYQPAPTASPQETPSAQPDEEGSISPSHGTSAFASVSSDTLDSLLLQIQAQLPAGNGNWSVYICNLADGSEAVFNNTPMQAASLIKLFIMGAVYENYDSLSQTYGASALDANLSPMITVSDNDAANTLVNYLGNGDSQAGMNAVNRFCQAHGYTSTSMGRLLLASNEFGDNYTSAYDCGKFLREIYEICQGTAQTSGLSHASEMFALLKQQQRTNKIPAALPQGVHVANKTGELSDVENDAGILYNTPGGTDLVISVMSQNLNNPSSAQSAIAQLSRFAYDFFNES